MAERNLCIRLSVVDGGKVKAELSEIGEQGVPRHHASNNTLTAPDGCKRFVDILP